MSNIVSFLQASAGSTDILLTGVLLPFLLIFVVLWGMLNMIKIFGNDSTSKKINLVISLVITIFAAFTDAWGLIATQLARFTGQFAFVMFIVVFIIGAILWAIGRSRGIYRDHVYGQSVKDFGSLKELDKQIAKVGKKMMDAEYSGDDAKYDTYRKTWTQLNEKKKELMDKLAFKHGY